MTIQQYQHLPFPSFIIYPLMISKDPKPHQGKAHIQQGWKLNCLHTHVQLTTLHIQLKSHTQTSQSNLLFLSANSNNRNKHQLLSFSRQNQKSDKNTSCIAARATLSLSTLYPQAVVPAKDEIGIKLVLMIQEEHLEGIHQR